MEAVLVALHLATPALTHQPVRSVPMATTSVDLSVLVALLLARHVLLQSSVRVVFKVTISQEATVSSVTKDAHSAKHLQQTVLLVTLVSTSVGQLALLVETAVFPALTPLAVFPATLGLTLTRQQVVACRVLLSSLPVFSALTLSVWSVLQA